MLKTYRLLIFGLALLAFSSTRGATMTFGENGSLIDAGSMGKFNIEFPALLNAKQEPVHKLLDKEVSANTATLKYEGGGTIRMLANDSGEVSLAFDQMPSDVKLLKMSMLIDISYTQGGKWKFGNSPEGTFPRDKPDKPQLFADHATTFDLTNYEGKTLSFHLPEHTYNELNDNRAWNWSIFCWHLGVPYNADKKTLTFTITEGKSANVDGDGKPVFLVDRIGQSTVSGDWPDKVKTLDELKADVESEKAYYAGLRQPKLDKIGGLPGSREKVGLKATGFFHVEEKGGKWFLADPEGNVFFHLGVCAVSPGDDYTLIKGREQSYEWIPSLNSEFRTAFLATEDGRVLSFHNANMIRKYGEPVALESFQARMIERLRKWGFNSIGAFTSLSKSVHEAGFPYVTHLTLNQWEARIPAIPGISGTWDPFDEQNVAKVQKSFAATLPEQADDPLLIGYFLANEPIYEDIPKIVPGLDAGYACKKRLVQMLSDKYKTIGAFNSAWGMSAESFDQLNTTKLHAQTQSASDDLHDFTGLFFDAYFKLVTDTFRKYDTHHMLIGNRLQPGTIDNEQLCRISGKYMDVISFNYYTEAVDKDLLNRIYKWTGGRPMMLSEFYWSASHESGLTGGREVTTQQERGLAYRNYVEQSAALGFVVGIEWFTLVDQATSGRWFDGFNGERANTGLIAVSDRPWKPMLAEMMKTNNDIYAVLFGQREPFAFARPTRSGN